MRDRNMKKASRKPVKGQMKDRTRTPPVNRNDWTSRDPIPQWTERATAADIERIVWKCVFAVQRKKLTPKQSNAMVYGLALIKDLMETREFESRLSKLEADRGGNNVEGGSSISITVGGA